MEAAQAAPKKNYFDDEERGRIRRALLRYMQENRIGVPTLQRAIAEAHNVVLDRIPQKSLQRFLADTHRTNDMLVRFCNEFLADLGDNPLDLFGDQLAAFYGVPAPVAGDDAPPALALDQWVGAFEGTSVPRPAKGIAVHDPGARTKISDLTLAARTGALFLRAAETVSNWTLAAAPHEAARRAYEGVAVATAGGLLIALRSSLTGAPRAHWLTPLSDSLVGHGTEPLGPLDPDPSNVKDTVQIDLVAFRRTAEPAHG